MGSCNGCGGCCNPVTVSQETFAGWLSWQEQEEPEDEAEHETWLNAQWAAKRLSVVGTRGDTVIAVCANYDVKTGHCLDYENRPPICKGYPWYGQKPGEARTPPDICGYWVDVPFGKRPAEWREVDIEDIQQFGGWSQWRPDPQAVDESAGPLTDEQAVSVFVETLAVALRIEFGTFLKADDESWRKAARGMAAKMGVTRVGTESNLPSFVLTREPVT